MVAFRVVRWAAVEIGRLLPLGKRSVGGSSTGGSWCLEAVRHGGSPASSGKASVMGGACKLDRVEHDGLTIEATRHGPEPGTGTTGSP